MKKVMCSFLFFTIALPVMASKLYTPEQLTRMINSGVYPDQGPVKDTQTKTMTFSNCKKASESVMSQMRGIYPVKTVVNTKMMYLVKAWANDGVITITCSEPDKKMVLTQSGYM